MKVHFAILAFALTGIGCSDAQKDISSHSLSESTKLVASVGQPFPATPALMKAEDSDTNSPAVDKNPSPPPAYPSTEKLNKDFTGNDPGPYPPPDNKPMQDGSEIDSPSFQALGRSINSVLEGGVIITEGQIRPRRRHENDMDYSKYNPFYWEGRQSKFTVEDASQTDQKSITFTLTTEWPQNYIPTRGPDFSAIYTGDPEAASETTRSKFAMNIRMQHIAGFRVFQVTLGPNDLAANADSFKKGQILTFEFRFFMDESFPGWAAQKAANPHNISAYYSEFLRIRVGEAGLYLDNPHAPNKIASPLRNSGGWTTTPTTRVEPWKALQQQALNLTHANSQSFMTGRTWFHTDLVSGEHIADKSDDKPTIFFEATRAERAAFSSTAYNVASCNTCHVNNGSSLLPAIGLPVDHTIVKTFDKKTGHRHVLLGDQLQTQGANAEGKLTVSNYETKVVTLDDGSTVTLKKPNFEISSNQDLGSIGLSPRRPPAMIGMGLLEAIPETTLKELALKSGGILQTFNGKIGRFGWKADKTSLREQIGAALKNDMGVLSKNFVALDCGNGCLRGKGELPVEAIDSLEAYIALLGVPPRFDPTNSAVVNGEAVFDRLNCQSCHVKSIRTGPSKFPELADQLIQPFTDLALHDMGQDLGEERPNAISTQWRTAPLWGLKNVKHATDDHLDIFTPGNISILWTDAQRVANQNPIQLLHDGRAQTLAEAILWHGGEASKSVKAYMALPKNDRLALETYLWDL